MNLGELLPLRKLAPIPSPFEKEAARSLLVDVRPGHYDENSVQELPLRYGEIRALHMWLEACAVEVLFDHPIHAHEEARLLAARGFASYWGSEVTSKALRRMLAEQAKDFPVPAKLAIV